MTDARKCPDITEDTVRAWLTAAKAPQPWNDEGIARAVRNALSMWEMLPTMILQGTAAYSKKDSEKTPLEKAQDAINGLRRALMKLEPLISANLESDKAANMPDSWINYEQKIVRKVRRMQSSLVDILPDVDKPDAENQVLIVAYQCFCQIVQNSFIKREDDNPAGLFIRSFTGAIWENCGIPRNATLEKILPAQEKLKELDFYASHLRRTFYIPRTFPVGTAVRVSAPTFLLPVRKWRLTR